MTLNVISSKIHPKWWEIFANGPSYCSSVTSFYCEFSSVRAKHDDMCANCLQHSCRCFQGTPFCCLFIQSKRCGESMLRACCQDYWHWTTNNRVIRQHCLKSVFTVCPVEFISGWFLMYFNQPNLKCSSYINSIWFVIMTGGYSGEMNWHLRKKEKNTVVLKSCSVVFTVIRAVTHLWQKCWILSKHCQKYDNWCIFNKVGSHKSCLFCAFQWY